VALNHVRKGLAKTATRRTRLAAIVLPPSVMLRWRMGMGDASTRWMSSFSRGRDLLVRFSPRRLMTNKAR
jgi:hypothetical protein